MRKGIATVAVVLAAAIGAARGQELQASGPVIYRLEADSSYQQGCFGMCLCPVLILAPAQGTFVLTPTGRDGAFRTFAVSEVNWTLPEGDHRLSVSGAGTYRTGGDPLLQRLELDLQVGDAKPEHFDSGLVPATDPFPGLDIMVSMFDMTCYDTVFDLRAVPVTDDQIHPYHLGNGSTFQRGCFDPCDCPLGEKLPIAGSFGLVELSRDPLFTEFAVVNVRWRVLNKEGNPRRIHIRGAGTYRVGGEFASMHQLSLDLRVGKEETARFDSGLVPGGAGFPRVDALISIHGVECFDTVIDLYAAPKRNIPRLSRPRSSWPVEPLP